MRASGRVACHDPVMGYPHRLLGEDEDIVLELHPHWKALLLPALALPLVVLIASFLWFEVPDGHRFSSLLRWVVFGAAVLALLFWSLIPFLRWRTALYVLTTRRLITRSGILSRQGRDMPLTRVNDASFSHGVIDRMLGCGTLVIESAGERGQLVLTAVPRVETVQREVYRQVEAQTGRAIEPSDSAGE
jgi:uncharacterized membrane protein YdbT with pleckstrin-like domain